MTTGKTIILTVWTIVIKVISLLFNTLSRFIIAFLPRSKGLLLSWLQSPSQWFWSPRKESFPLIPFYLPWSDGTKCHDLNFLNVEFQASFFTLLFHLHQEVLYFLFIFLPLECCHLHIWGCWYLSWQSSFQLWDIQLGISHNLASMWNIGVYQKARKISSTQSTLLPWRIKKRRANKT